MSADTLFSREVVMRHALERYANGAKDPTIAIRALTDIDGRSPYLAAVRELWSAQGAYGHRRKITRPPRPRASDPVDPEFERAARRESLRALRDCWHEIWACLGAPITTIRLEQRRDSENGARYGR